MSTHDSRTEPSAAVMRNVTASKPDGTAPAGSVAIVPVAADDDTDDEEDGTGAALLSAEHDATARVRATSSSGRRRR